MKLVPAEGKVAVRNDDIEYKLAETEEADEIKSASVELRSGVSIVDQLGLADSALRVLKEMEVAKPVFEVDDALIVPLAEIRIEDSNEGKLEEVSIWVGENSDLAELVSVREGRIVLKPKSDEPVDALTIANRITEEVAPELSQIRFLRMVNRPDVSKE